MKKKKNSPLNKGLLKAEKREKVSKWNFMQCYYAIYNRLRMRDFKYDVENSPYSNATKFILQDFLKYKHEEILDKYYHHGMYKGSEEELMQVYKDLRNEDYSSIDYDVLYEEVPKQ